MADASTRRSVRSRTNQPTTSSHHSSASSISSGRADRNTRTSAKIDSPRKSTPSGSLSSEPADESVAQTIEDGLQTRRSRKRGQEEEEMTASKNDEAIEDGDGDEDDGTVRCICGLPEYPGPPQWTEDDKKQSGDMEFITAEDVTEDLAGFFLSCDNCKVWQHGGCVGIKNEDVSPEEYYCEQCRKDLHKIFTATDGQKYSLYLPLQPTYSPPGSRTASFSKDGEGKRSRSDRAGSAMTNAKRRSTMNSRDAAYDEEEQLRRAIAASKGEEAPESTDGGNRRTKRGRSDSEEKQESSKRQRTASRSLTPAGDAAQLESQANSDEDSKTRNGSTKKIRGAAAKNHSAKEAREERERMRLESANKRKGRAERRRVEEESEPVEEPAPIRPSTKAVSPPRDDPPPASVPPQPDTPPIAPTPQSHSQHKKGAGGRPPQTKKSKVGKNQYTKDRDMPDTADSPGRSSSRGPKERERDIREDKEHTNGDIRKDQKELPKKKVNGITQSGVVKVGWGEMRRKVAGMLDYIAKVQVEMADQTSMFGSGSAGEENAKGVMRGLAGAIVPMLKEQRTNGEIDIGANGVDGSNEAEGKKFDNMGLLEMMEFLTRRLILWQQEYGT